MFTLASQLYCHNGSKFLRELVVEAVGYEPVSAGKSLLTGKITGKNPETARSHQTQAFAKRAASVT
jgi:hypothetical protein